MLEQKTLSIKEVKMVDLPDGAGYSFEGYGSVFGVVDSHGDEIKQGAYADVIASFKTGETKIMLMFSHRHSDLPIGKIDDMWEDDYGLKIKATLTQGLSVAEDVRAALNHKTVEGLSIGYSLAEGDYEYKESGGRIISRVDYLGEISVLPFASNAEAKIDLLSVKSALEEADSYKLLEKSLRDSGMSRDFAKTFVSKTKSIVLAEIEHKKVEEQKSIDNLLLAIKGELPTDTKSTETPVETKSTENFDELALLIAMS